MKPDFISIVYQHNGGYCYCVAIKYFGGNELFSSHKFMTKKDALDWCNREYYGIPVNHI